MSIAGTVRKYTSDSEPFIKLIHSLCRDLHSNFRLSIRIDDYEARQLVKAWAREIENANRPAADLNLLLEEVVGDLLERLIRQGAIFQLDETTGPRAAPKHQSIASYVRTHFYEYLAVQVGLSIVREMLGSQLITPNPNKILDAAVIIHAIPERAPVFVNLLGLSPLIEAISAGH